MNNINLKEKKRIRKQIKINRIVEKNILVA